MRITDVTITPIAFRDPPLLNSWGVHEPLALRTIVKITAEGELIGWGEGSGEASTLAALRATRATLIGLDPFDLHAVESAVHVALPSATDRDLLSAFAIFEVACLDLQGKIAGVPVCDLLGGAIRDTVPFSAYLFYKWADHIDEGGRKTSSDDQWGAAVDPNGIVEQARKLINENGFRSLKLKGGVFPPDQEIAAVRALATAFPSVPLRIDPNGAWSVDTSLKVARELSDVLEYLEDPTLALDDMATVAREGGLPLATNMCVTSFKTIPPALAIDAVQIVLADHHYWGGLRRSRELARVCDTFGLGLSMHSNSHLGISLAAMTHLAASTPNLSYACDTHYPWNRRDDVLVEPFEFTDGSLAVSRRPGLGVEVDEAKVALLAEQYIRSGRTTRDDTAYMRHVNPQYDPTLPRF